MGEGSGQGSHHWGKGASKETALALPIHRPPLRLPTWRAIEPDVLALLGHQWSPPLIFHVALSMLDTNEPAPTPRVALLLRNRPSSGRVTGELAGELCRRWQRKWHGIERGRGRHDLVLNWCETSRWAFQPKFKWEAKLILLSKRLLNLKCSSFAGKIFRLHENTLHPTYKQQTFYGPRLV